MIEYQTVFLVITNSNVIQKQSLHCIIHMCAFTHSIVESSSRLEINGSESKMYSQKQELLLG